MKNVKAIYLNDMNSREDVVNIAKAMKESGVRRIIFASILGIYDEVSEVFGKWNKYGVARFPLDV